MLLYFFSALLVLGERRSEELRAVILKNLETHRRLLQAARDALQAGIDQYEVMRVMALKSCFI